MAMLRHVAGLALRRSATSPAAVVARSFVSPGCTGPASGLALLQRPAPPPAAAAAAAASRFFSNGRSSNTKSALDKRMEETKEALYPRKMHTHDSAAKIRIVMKSFNNQKSNLMGLAPYTQKIGLPESRSLYTVLRSPHIDKKSREQFSMHVKKVFVVKKAETHELAKKFFWLKRMRIVGLSMKSILVSRPVWIKRLAAAKVLACFDSSSKTKLEAGTEK